MQNLQQLTKLKDIKPNALFKNTCYSIDLEDHLKLFSISNNIQLLSNSTPLLSSYEYSPQYIVESFTSQGFPIEIDSNTTYLLTCNPYHINLNKKYFDLNILLTTPSNFIYTLANQHRIPIEGLFHLIHFYAFQNNISDIHLYQFDQWYRIEFHYKSTQPFQFNIEHSFGKKLSNYLKLISHIDPSITRKPQDGAYDFNHSSVVFDARLSTLPTYYGEMLSIRIFKPNSHFNHLEDLGFSTDKTSLIKTMVHNQHGLILITGATGSGKSTTLYTILKLLVKLNRHIITLEDPIEQRIPGIHQTSINQLQGYTFLSGFKSVLRHNPDVIAIGEIRDAETADIVINAAYSGHLVIASIHTNSIETTILRLSNLGCNPFLISYCLKGIISQKLAPSASHKLSLESSVLCCKTPYIIYDVEKQLTDFIKHNILLE